MRRKQRKMSFEELSEFVKNKFNGNLVVLSESYYHKHHKVKLHCNIHNIDFETYAHTIHSGKYVCPICREENSHNTIISWEVLLKRFRDKYGNKFSYDETSYKGINKLLKIHCNDCGENFELTPTTHLRYNNGGCPNCKKYRIVKCSCCGAEVVADYHVNGNLKIYCDECRKRMRLISKHKSYSKSKKKEEDEIINDFKYCKLCGRKLNKNLKCDNEFCNKHSIQQINSLIKNFGFDETKLGTLEVE